MIHFKTGFFSVESFSSAVKKKISILILINKCVFHFESNNYCINMNLESYYTIHPQTVLKKKSYKISLKTILCHLWAEHEKVLNQI